MTQISYRNLHFPPFIVQHAVRLYVRFNLSLRDIEDLLAERRIEVSYETICRSFRTSVRNATEKVSRDTTPSMTP